jgi:hypothetical protein
MLIKDSSRYFGVKLSEHRIKDTIGRLVIKDCVFARSGVQKYYKWELFEETMGTDEGNEILDIKRPWKEVCSPITIASFEAAPITDNHPEKNVTIKNYAELAKGVANNIHAVADEQTLHCDIILYDPDLIKRVENHEINELSAGYSCDIDETELIQKNIRGNHIAVVPEGRAGVAVLHDANPFKNSNIESRSRSRSNLSNSITPKYKWVDIQVKDADADGDKEELTKRILKNINNKILEFKKRIKKENWDKVKLNIEFSYKGNEVGKKVELQSLNTDIKGVIKPELGAKLGNNVDVKGVFKKDDKGKVYAEISVNGLGKNKPKGNYEKYFKDKGYLPFNAWVKDALDSGVLDDNDPINSAIIDILSGEKKLTDKIESVENENVSEEEQAQNVDENIITDSKGEKYGRTTKFIIRVK